MAILLSLSLLVAGAFTFFFMFVAMVGDERFTLAFTLALSTTIALALTIAFALTALTYNMEAEEASMDSRFKTDVCYAQQGSTYDCLWDNQWGKHFH